MAMIAYFVFHSFLSLLPTNGDIMQ